ncbi:response regulator transcription factor [Trinickia violacea]|uniref:Response regulator transcription factor n=1 Tax=Trinickia violacea TaxID=2571746 RepID=A0A4P8IMG6_9BURK|nr:response regulator transcription factor [Trinickia violacea]
MFHFNRSQAPRERAWQIPVPQILATGHTVFHPQRRGAQKNDSGHLADPCSLREREVLKLLATGLSDKQIARELGISDMTARKHRSNLLRKTASPNVCALLYRAALSGWLGDMLPGPPPDSR